MNIKKFIKNEPVLIISGILAVLSAFIVKPSKEYLGYINFRTIILLFCLMTVVAGMKKAGAFDALARGMLTRVSSVRQIAVSLTILSFVLAMFLTNDVTLITVVPFTILVLDEVGIVSPHILIMETIAANLGSMLTPFGNPQNLYLFTRYSFTMNSFLELMLPYTVFSFILVVVATFFYPYKVGKKLDSIESVSASGKELNKKNFIIYFVLFILSIATVAGVIPDYVLLAIIAITCIILDKKLFTEVDYSLLLTFVFFFIFIGNMGNVSDIKIFLENEVNGNEVITSIAASQFVSNVPCAILSSNFTNDGNGLVIGTNLGGLGTLIASMASLITYKIYLTSSQGQKVGTVAYIGKFTVWNVLFLIILVVFYYTF